MLERFIVSSVREHVGSDGFPYAANLVAIWEKYNAIFVDLTVNAPRSSLTTGIKMYLPNRRKCHGQQTVISLQEAILSSEKTDCGQVFEGSDLLRYRSFTTDSVGRTHGNLTV
jgi:hypothetical protein